MGCIFSIHNLGLHFDTIIVLGMVLAFLLNAFFYVSGISKNTSLLATSFMMAASYFTSNHFINLSADHTDIYLSWILYDVVTIGLILGVNKLLTQKLCVAAYYIILGLVLNATLCAVLHVDLRVLLNREPWWFWYFYTLSINIIDVCMVAALIINRDYLRLNFLGRYIKSFLIKKGNGKLA